MNMMNSYCCNTSKFHCTCIIIFQQYESTKLKIILNLMKSICQSEESSNFC